MLNRKSPAAICWSDCNDTFMHVILCLSVCKQGTQLEQIFWHLKVTIICSTLWCSMPSCTGNFQTLPGDCINFVHFVFSCGNSRSATVYLITDVHTSIFKEFHTGGAHADTTIHKVVTHRYLQLNFSLHKKLSHCMLAKEVTDGHFCHNGLQITSGAHKLDLYSYCKA
jgi:hypothetical protein